MSTSSTPSSTFARACRCVALRCVAFWGLTDRPAAVRSGRVVRPLIWGEAPLARESHTATLVGRKIYFMYGCSATAFMDDIVVLDMDSLEWSRPPVNSLKRPSMRFGHTATLVNDHEIW